jgi:beta-phosphoglucomutase
MLKAIIFDMDGVLLDTIQLHFKAWEHLFAEHGKRIAWKDFAPVIGTTDIFTGRRFMKKAGLRKDIGELCEEKARYYLKLLKKYGKLFPGTRQVLKKYHGKYQIMVASSEWDYVIDKVLETFRLDEYVDCRIGKEDVTEHKPDPEVYKKCLKILKLKPEECVVIEDSLPGIEAGKRAGIRVIAVAQTYPKSKLKNTKADAVIGKISELKVLD